jgi:hypothetical protein
MSPEQKDILTSEIFKRLKETFRLMFVPLWKEQREKKDSRPK